jgi:DNA-binding transcriptional MerR regulator
MTEYFTSSEAAIISRCSRRQLQYWRDRGIVVPEINASGKGRNVYYSESNLLELIVMHYFLSRNLSFELSEFVLNNLKEKSASKLIYGLHANFKRFMIRIDSEDQYFLEDFNLELALDWIESGLPVVPFWEEKVHLQLKDNLRNFWDEIRERDLRYHPDKIGLRHIPKRRVCTND